MELSQGCKEAGEYRSNGGFVLGQEVGNDEGRVAGALSWWSLKTSLMSGRTRMTHHFSVLSTSR